MYVLTDEEAAQLKHPTSRIYGDSGGYMIQIEVFHQLHCLNALRKLAYGIHELGTGHTAQVHAGMYAPLFGHITSHPQITASTTCVKCSCVIPT